MKTLKESLFDKDIEKKEIKIGSLYEQTATPHYNSFSNDPYIFMETFKTRELEKWNCEFVDTKNNFVDYWENLEGMSGLSALIDIILQMPVRLIDTPDPEGFKKELKPFVKSSKYNKLRVFIRKIKDFVEITIYDNLFFANPHSMRITLKER